MAHLIAQGPETHHRWRRKLPANQTCVLGRTQAVWSAPWDDHISSQHIEFCWERDRLKVRRLDDARNPVFFGGREVDEFSVETGQHFVIGGTTFSVADEQVAVTIDAPDPLTEQTYSAQYLKRLRFRNADQRIAFLGQLPEIISSAATDNELFVRLVNLLLAGIPRASAAALVRTGDAGADDLHMEVLHWDRRLLTGRAFQPSARLIHKAVETRESIVHLWSDGKEHARTAFTVSEDVDWAFATPVAGASCRGWAIYIAGSDRGSDSAMESRVSESKDLRDDLKFAELTATTLGNLRDLKQLEHNQAVLRQFLSPVVLDAMAGQDPEVVLAPREAEVSVLFCDLRGFSRTSEQMADDLPGLLNRVSLALGVTTHHILEQGGVVGDFHGDAAMGFWGWPLSQPDSASRACMAALGIRAELQAASRQESHALADFRMGIGIATGRAVAGKIGTIDQVKVTVFGPVVNLASRLEGMTDVIRTPILIDEKTAQAVRQSTPETSARVRRVALVKPYGMDHTLEISELLPPESQYPLMSGEHIAAYEAALDRLLEGDFAAAFSRLHQVPAEDRVKDFLTVFIAQHNRSAPPDWNGVIPISKK